MTWGREASWLHLGEGLHPVPGRGLRSMAQRRVAAGGGSPHRVFSAVELLMAAMILGDEMMMVEANNLLRDGAFETQPTPTGEFVGSSGAFERVTAEQGMYDFPGTDSAAALRLPPGSRFVVRSSLGRRDTGWYRVRGFMYASGAYNGAQAALTVEIVSSNGAPSPHSTSHAVSLRRDRDQWLHYDEWVPSSYVGEHKAKLSFAPAHSSGDLQLAQLEVLFEEFDARQAYDISPLTMWLDPAISPGGAPTTVGCTAVGPTECPDNWQGDGEIYFAFDGNLNTVYYMSTQNVPRIALELDLGETVEVCALTVVYNGGLGATWRVKGRTEQGSWTLYGEAGPASSGKMLVTNAVASNIALPCTDTRRLRIEMESTELLAKLHDIIVLQRGSQCDCRHGGICQGQGDCRCPSESNWPLRIAGVNHFNPAFGWGGPICNDAACDAIVGRGCDNDEPFNVGWCGGPNTCTCPAGWHGTAGTEQQCTHTKCGDGVVTTVATCTGVPCDMLNGRCSCSRPDNPVEQCDDGNNIADDGCGPTCQFEPLPQDVVRREVQRPGGVIKYRDVVNSDTQPPSIETVAATIFRSPAEVCCIEVIGTGPEAEVRYEAEVGYKFVETILVCLTEVDAGGVPQHYCQNGGLCELSGGNKRCTCTAPVREGDLYTVAGVEKVVERGSALIGKYRGYEGETCEISACEQECDHGGWCVKDAPSSVAYCEGCMEGWTGEYCGTVDHSLGTPVLISAVAVVMVLAIGLLIVVVKHSWLPIQARGPVSLICSYVGGIIWVYSAVSMIWGELTGYDASRPFVHKLWLPLVCGSGLWLAASIVYMRTMASVHIYGKVRDHICAVCIVEKHNSSDNILVEQVPIVVPIPLAIGIVPWIVASYVEKCVWTVPHAPPCD